MRGVVVEQVVPSVTYPLRREVLRPQLEPSSPLDAVAFPGDLDPAAAHFAAYAGAGSQEGLVVGVAAVLREPSADGAAAWRLRGMAVASSWRGEHVGALLVDRAVEHVARQITGGDAQLWCLARQVAVGFYSRLGFMPAGEWGDVPGIGPHLPMSRPVAPFRRERGSG